jgi:predicted DNA-binding transcriptional regulator AlpA
MKVRWAGRLEIRLTLGMAEFDRNGVIACIASTGCYPIRLLVNVTTSTTNSEIEVSYMGFSTLQENVEQRFLTETQVAKMAGLSPKTLQRWRLLKQGPDWKKFGGAVRYDREIIEEFFRSC